MTESGVESRVTTRVENPDGADGADCADGADTPRWVSRALVVTCFAVAALPFLLTIAHSWGAHWSPAGDRALIELHVRDVLDPAHIPLLGPYSRYGWEHPGPLGYWVLAVPYAALGAESWSLLVATALVNAVSALGFLAIVKRRGGLDLLVPATFVVVALTTSLGPRTLIDSWNPYVTVLPLLLYLGAVWSARVGERWALPLAVFLGTYLVQAHVAYAVLVLATGAWALTPAVRALRARRRSAPAPAPTVARAARPWRGALLVTTAVVVVTWSPVVYDQVAGTGNAVDVVRYFATTEAPTTGFGPAALMVGRELGIDAAWFRDPEPVAPTGDVLGVNVRELATTLAVIGVLAAGAWWVRRRDRSREAQTAWEMQTLALVVLAGGWFGVARISDVVWDYLIRWWWTAAAFVWLAAAFSAWQLLRRSPRIRAVLGPAATVVLLGFALLDVRLFSALTATAPSPEPEFDAPTTAITPGLLAGVPEGTVVFVRHAGGGVGSVADGVRLQLDRAGRIVTVPDGDTGKFGRWRGLGGLTPTLTVWVVMGPDIEEWRTRTDVRYLSSWDPLTPDEHREYVERSTRLTDQLRAGGRPDLAEALHNDDGIFGANVVPGVDLANLERVEQLRRRGRPAAVFIEPFQLRHTT